MSSPAPVTAERLQLGVTKCAALEELARVYLNKIDTLLLSSPKNLGENCVEISLPTVFDNGTKLERSQAQTIFYYTLAEELTKNGFTPAFVIDSASTTLYVAYRIELPRGTLDKMQKYLSGFVYKSVASVEALKLKGALAKRKTVSAANAEARLKEGDGFLLSDMKTGGSVAKAKK